MKFERCAREYDNGRLNVRFYGRAQCRASRRGTARHGMARSTVQRNALIRVAACAEFERLTDSRDTHVSDGDYSF